MKQIAILGTGNVGRIIGGRLIELGHAVCMGSRTANNPKSAEWAGLYGPKASHNTFAEAAAFGEIIFNCTKGESTLNALSLVGADKLSGKILIDLSNPLDFSNGMPPSLFPQWSNTNSLGEEIQKAYPETRVVKTLNIVSAEVMVSPSLSGGAPTMFVCGNREEARQEVTLLLRTFGWEDIADLGDITAARGMEMLLPLWIRSWGAIGHPRFGFKIIR